MLTLLQVLNTKSNGRRGALGRDIDIGRRLLEMVDLNGLRIGPMLPLHGSKENMKRRASGVRGQHVQSR